MVWESPVLLGCVREFGLGGKAPIKIHQQRGMCGAGLPGGVGTVGGAGAAGGLLCGGTDPYGVAYHLSHRGSLRHPFTASNPETAALLLRCCAEEEVPLLILGNGSNLLVSDKGIPGLCYAFPAVKFVSKRIG